MKHSATWFCGNKYTSAQRWPLLRRAISIQAEGKVLLEKHAIAPSAARLCWAAPNACSGKDSRNKVSLAFCICFAVRAVTLRKMQL